NDESARDPLQDAQHDQPFETRREAAQQRADAEGGQSQREYPATPVNISQPAGENEKGALAEQISVVDVALSLQGPDDVRGQIPRTSSGPWRERRSEEHTSELQSRGHI